MQQSQEMFIMGWKFASAYLVVLHVSLPQSLWYLGYCFDFSVIYFLWVDYLRTGAFALLDEYIINNNYISRVGWRHKSIRSWPIGSRVFRSSALKTLLLASID